jgi:hypothetical protein
MKLVNNNHEISLVYQIFQKREKYCEMKLNWVLSYYNSKLFKYAYW